MKTSIFVLLAFTLVVLVAITGCERKIVNEAGDDEMAFTSCFTCHGEDGLILAAQSEWQNSFHATGANVYYTNRSTCVTCHDHQGFVDYVTTGDVNSPYDNVSAIHCFTCHSPHEAGNLELRTEASYTLENGDAFNHGEGNLCVNCHHSRYDVGEIDDSIEVSSHWGPHHGPQGDLLNGNCGYEFDGYTYEQSTHATAIENSCVGCHMATVETHEGYKLGGHSLNIVDEETGADLSILCQECHASADSINFTADADYDHDGVIEGFQTEMEGLLDSLGTLLFAAGIIDSTDSPVSGTIGPNEAGALYNYLLLEEDRSLGVHNYKYSTGLAQSSIEYLD
jgi:hypothetical protein